MSMHLNNVLSRYGAPMGRVARHEDCSHEAKVHVQHTRLDRGGYDSGGAYWGVGMPLWHVWADDASIDYFVRALDRATAKSLVRQRYARVTFYR